MPLVEVVNNLLGRCDSEPTLNVLPKNANEHTFTQHHTQLNTLPNPLHGAIKWYRKNGLHFHHTHDEQRLPFPDSSPL